MGISKKHQVGGGLDTDGEKWVFAEISIRESLKPVKTKLKKPERESVSAEEICVTPTRKESVSAEEICVTPTRKESTISEKLKCPAAPRKRRPVLKCRSNVRIEYFVPPSDLESVFIQRR
ncbi:PREDICTED: uncharacterized protein LOC104780007 [Camelina sativa]|uniref:Uncharacterized protein LOC104780007 n=1 Tax=Camelina sativa TaxID=90675 RepID=A0ABM0YLB9_CAMSA|nr:PREDICTED: uncharacterized protein LOC104780007 [Camelina sativa]